MEKNFTKESCVVMKKGCEIGEGTTLKCGCILGRGTIIGKDSFVSPGVCIMYGRPGKDGKSCVIGDRVYIGANSTILPGIKICDDVLIGAMSLVDKDITEPGTYYGIPARKQIPNQKHTLIRGKYGHFIDPSAVLMPESVVREGTKWPTFIGPNVEVQHNASIGHDATVRRGSIIHAGAIIAGFVDIGEDCKIRLNATIRPGVKICASATVGMGAVVTKNITKPGVYIGIPAHRITLPHRIYYKLKRRSNA